MMCQLHLLGINPLSTLYGILAVKQIWAKLPSKYYVIYFEKGNILRVLQVKYFRYVKPCELLSSLTHRLLVFGCPERNFMHSTGRLACDQL